MSVGDSYVDAFPPRLDLTIASVKKWLENNSRVYYWIRQARLQASSMRTARAASVSQEVARRPAKPAFSDRVVPNEARVYARRERPAVHHAWETTQALIRRMNESVVAHWNANGHPLAAEVLSHYVLESVADVATSH